MLYIPGIQKYDFSTLPILAHNKHWWSENKRNLHSFDYYQIKVYNINWKIIFAIDSKKTEDYEWNYRRLYILSLWKNLETNLIGRETLSTIKFWSLSLGGQNFMVLRVSRPIRLVERFFYRDSMYGISRMVKVSKI